MDQRATRLFLRVGLGLALTWRAKRDAPALDVAAIGSGLVLVLTARPMRPLVA